MKKIKVSQKDHYDEEVVRLHNAGFSYREISERLGGSYDYVKRIGRGNRDKYLKGRSNCSKSGPKPILNDELDKKYSVMIKPAAKKITGYKKIKRASITNICQEIGIKEGVDFVSLKENIDTTTPQGKFMLTVFGALAELERESILQRQAEGVAIAKAQGKYKGRQPIKLDEDKFEAAVKEWRDKKRTAVSIMKEFNISSQTFYRRVNSKDI